MTMRAPAPALAIAAALMLVGPGLALGKGDKNPAQAAPVAVSSADFMAESFALCANLALGADGADEKLAAAGWEAESDNGTTLPFYEMISYTKTFDGLGEATIWGTIEHYPGKILGYCRVDATDSDGNILDFADLAGLPDMQGSSQTTDDGSYGAWAVETSSPDKQMFAIAQLNDGEFQLEINTLIDQASTEPAAAPAPEKTED